MELTIPVYAKTIRDALKPRRRVVNTASVPPLAAKPPAQGLFRRTPPTTFHRCLAVHMHYAKHASALD